MHIRIGETMKSFELFRELAAFSLDLPSFFLMTSESSAFFASKSVPSLHLHINPTNPSYPNSNLCFAEGT